MKHQLRNAPAAQQRSGAGHERMSSVPSKILSNVTLATGLVERTYASGKVVHRSTVYYDDTEKTETFSGLTRTEAKKLHRDRQHEVDEGSRPTVAKTLLEVRDEAFAFAQRQLDKKVDEPPLRKGTLRNYKDAFRLRIEQMPIGKKKLSEIDQAVALRFLRELRECGRATNTQNGTVSALRFVLRYAREMKYMKLDPFAGIPKKEFPKQKPRKDWEAKTLGPTEISYLVEDIWTPAFLGATDTLYANAVILYVCVGMRLSELLALRWQDVDLVEGILHIRQQLEAGEAAHVRANPTLVDLKAGEARDIPMLPAVSEALLRQLEHEQGKELGELGDFVFTSAAGEVVTHDNMKSAVRRAGRVSRLGSGFGAQVLRRTFCSAAAGAGIPSVEAAKMTGHDPAVFDEFYAKPNREKKQAEQNMQKLLSWGLGAASPDSAPTPEPVE